MFVCYGLCRFGVFCGMGWFYKTIPCTVAWECRLGIICADDQY